LICMAVERPIIPPPMTTTSYAFDSIVNLSYAAVVL